MKFTLLDGDSCSIDRKGSSCCKPVEEKKSLKEHWNKAYINNPEDRLGWYEEVPEETICLIEKCNLSPQSTILNVGVGTSTLIDFLLLMGYQNIIATDISDKSINKLKQKLGKNSYKVAYIVDDLTKPTLLTEIEPVALWVDRAVLHFFTDKEEKKTYFDLVRSKIMPGGFAIFAEFSLSGATKCSGLPIHRYSTEMLADNLGDKFELVGGFNHVYTMPSGAERPYIYTLFKKK